MTRLFTFLLAFTCSLAYSQRLLERHVSVSVDEVNSSQFLDAVSLQEQIKFAYNPRDFNPDSTFTVNVQNTSMKQMLKAVFHDQYEFKEYKDYILFLKKRSEKVHEKRTVSGYLVNVETGDFIGVGSVSELGKLNTTLSDNSGFYEIELPDEYDSYGLVVSKYGYQDTVLVIDRSVEIIDIRLKPLPILDAPEPSVSGKSTVVFVTSNENQEHAKNYVSPFFRFAQFSVLPFLGTNLGLSGVVSNSVSLNLFGGYSFSTTGVELGGLFNIDRQGMFGLQAAGWANINGGKVAGFQMAGITNINTGITHGVQAAGIYNNATGSFSGLQFAGIANVAAAGGTGAQLAGIANVSAQGRSALQLSAFHNHADTSYMQASAITNYANRNSGLQLGLVNATRELRGVQIGLVNISTSGKGVPVGLFSYSRDGYNSLDLIFDETLFTTIRFTTGVNALYNLFQFSWNPFSSLTAYGLGLGTRWNFGKVGFEVNSHFSQVNEGELVESLNGLLGLGVLFRYTLGPVQLAVGPEFKLLSSQWKDENGNFLSDLAPYVISEWVYRDTFHQNWIGGNISIKYILHE